MLSSDVSPLISSPVSGYSSSCQPAAPSWPLTQFFLSFPSASFPDSPVYVVYIAQFFFFLGVLPARSFRRCCRTIPSHYKNRGFFLDSSLFPFFVMQFFFLTMELTLSRHPLPRWSDKNDLCFPSATAPSGYPVLSFTKQFEGRLQTTLVGPSTCPIFSLFFDLRIRAYSRNFRQCTLST